MLPIMWRSWNQTQPLLREGIEIIMGAIPERDARLILHQNDPRHV